jgi:hypothetical protein
MSVSQTLAEVVRRKAMGRMKYGNADYDLKPHCSKRMLH